MIISDLFHRCYHYLLPMPNQGGPGAAIRVRDDYNRMFSFVRELKPPHLELVFHSCSKLQPESRASSSLSFSGVKYFSRLPRGNGSLASAFTSVRVKVPSPSSFLPTRIMGTALSLRPSPASGSKSRPHYSCRQKAAWVWRPVYGYA